MNLLSIFVLAFALQIEPIPDPIPNSILEGPITDAITAKFETLFKKQAEETKAMEARLIAKFGERIETMTRELEAAKAERVSILEGIRTWNAERVGLMNRIQKMADNVRESMSEFRSVMTQFTPFKWILNWAREIMWSILVFVVITLSLLGILLAVMLRLYLWVKNTIVPEGL